MSTQEKFVARRTRIKRRLILINIASGLCLLFVPVWAAVRLFFCWEDSCSGPVCSICELHWVISVLLILFLLGFVFMSLELFRISSDRPDEDLPDHIEDPWIPGVKTASRTLQGLSSVIHKTAENIGKVSGSEALSKFTKGIATGTKSIPGMKSLQKGAKYCTDTSGNAVRRMERGRELLEGQGPAKWTFVFTVIALLGALFLMVGPFRNIFWS